MKPPFFALRRVTSDSVRSGGLCACGLRIANRPPAPAADVSEPAPVALPASPLQEAFAAAYDAEAAAWDAAAADARKYAADVAADSQKYKAEFAETLDARRMAANAEAKAAIWWWANQKYADAAADALDAAYAARDAAFTWEDAAAAWVEAGTYGGE